MKRFTVFVQVWALSCAACFGAAAVSFVYLDVRLAVHFWDFGRDLRPLSDVLGAAVILAGESAVTVGLVLARIVRGRLSRFGETLAIACLASICAYGINSEVFKPFFGVPAPARVIGGATHAFNWLMGSSASSFPSGHMMLAGAFAGVFMRLYRASVWPLCALLMLAAGLLVAGGWHFLSDVIVGTFVGLSAGMLAGEAWAVHGAARA